MGAGILGSPYPVPYGGDPPSPQTWLLGPSFPPGPALAGMAAGDTESCCVLCSWKSVISSWAKAISSILRYTTSPGLLSPSEWLPGENGTCVTSLVETWAP